MTQDEKIALLAEWQASIEASNRRIKPIAEALGLAVESPIHQAVWGLQNAYTKAVGRLVGDGGDWLGWYASENDFGRKHMEAGPNAATRHISTLADLVWVMGVEA